MFVGIISVTYELEHSAQFIPIYNQEFVSVRLWQQIRRNNLEDDGTKLAGPVITLFN